MKNNPELRRGKSRLLQAVISGCGIDELILLGEEILGTPFALCTVNHLVWYVSPQLPPGGLVPGTRGAILNASRLPEEVRGAFLMEGTFAHLFADNQQHCCLQAIRFRSKLWGYSAMVSRTPFTAITVELHRLFCDILAEEVEKQDRARQALPLSREEILLLDLLEDPGFTYDQREDERLSLPGAGFLEIVAVRSRRQAGLLAPDHTVIDEIKDLLSCEICFGYNEKIIVLVPKGTAFELWDQLEGYLQARDMLAGVSHPFVRLDNLRHHYGQAQRALLYEPDRELPCMQFYTKVIFQDIVKEEVGHIPVQSICDPDIQTIVHHDRQHGTKLARTLKTYIESGYNVQVTAKKLRIHRNSVMARLDKIKSLSGGRDLLSIDSYFSIVLLEEALHGKPPA